MVDLEVVGGEEVGLGEEGQVGMGSSILVVVGWVAVELVVEMVGASGEEGVEGGLVVDLHRSGHVCVHCRFRM